MNANEYVLAQGIRDTRSTFETWQRGRWTVLGGWFALSFAIALTLLGATLGVASVVTADPTPIVIPGIGQPGDALDVLNTLWRNSLVLAFHATACIAGFIAGASMPVAARSRTGFSRWVHIKAGQFAITFVVGVTLFSLSTQAFFLGFQGSSLAYQLGISPGELVLSVLPHALIELTALFLPLAAWILASRKGQWNRLLAATFVTVAIAIPMLVIGALIEVYIWPQILTSIAPFAGLAYG